VRSIPFDARYFLFQHIDEQKIVTRNVSVIYRGKHDREPVLACKRNRFSIEGRRVRLVVVRAAAARQTILYAIDGLLYQRRVKSR